MIRLLFAEPVSNAKLGKMFPKLKYVKTNFRCSLGVKRLENTLNIMELWPNFSNKEVKR